MSTIFQGFVDQNATIPIVRTESGGKYGVT